MKTGFLDFVEDILDAMDQAEILLTGVSYEEFAADFRITFAVVRALEIMGEAARRLPPGVRDRCPDVPRKLHSSCAWFWHCVSTGS